MRPAGDLRQRRLDPGDPRNPGRRLTDEAWQGNQDGGSARRLDHRFAATSVSGKSVRAAVSLLMAGLTLLPTTAAQASTMQAGYSNPSRYEWWFSNWQVQQRVWPLTTGAGVTVAVLDTGVQASVSDLRGVVLPGGDTTGAGSNGESDFDISHDGHGTAMAVLISGQGYGTGIVGIAPAAKILPVHADNAANSSATWLAAGIRFAVEHGAQVVNMSEGLLSVVAGELRTQPTGGSRICAGTQRCADRGGRRRKFHR